MLHMTDAEWDQRVANGAKCLTPIKPTWLDLFDADTLDMGSNCVLDQVFADEARRACADDGFQWATRNIPEIGENIADYGFGVGSGLKDAWIRLVNRLRGELQD